MKIIKLYFLFSIVCMNSFAQIADLTGVYLNGIKMENEISCYNFDTLLIVVKPSIDVNKFERVEGGFFILSFDSASGKLIDESSFVQWRWDSTVKEKFRNIYLASEIIDMKKNWLPMMAYDNFRNGSTHSVMETLPSGGNIFKPITEFYHIKRYCELRLKVMSNHKKDTTILCNRRYEMKNLYITKRIKDTRPMYADELIIEEPKIAQFEKCKITGEKIKMTVDEINALKTK